MKSKSALQTFGYFVDGNGNCSDLVDYDLHHYQRRSQKMKLDENRVKTLIYSDFEKTLSHMIQVQFEAKEDSSKKNCFYYL